MQSKTRALVLTALMAAVMAVLSPFTIPIGPIPLSLGVLAVFFAGAMLPPAQAAASLVVYILLGAIGLPVFSGFRGGPQVLAGPTGGYILGYFFLVLAVSFAVRRGLRYPLQLAVALAALVLFYLAGTLWYMAVTGASFASGLAACVAPFVLPDAAKAALALALAAALNRRLAKGSANR